MISNETVNVCMSSHLGLSLSSYISKSLNKILNLNKVIDQIT